MAVSTRNARDDADEDEAAVPVDMGRQPARPDKEENKWPKLPEAERSKLEYQRQEILASIRKNWNLDAFIDIFPSEKWLKGTLENMTDAKWDLETLTDFLETSRMSIDRGDEVRETLARLWGVRSKKNDPSRRVGTEQKEKEKNLCDDLRRIREDGELEKPKPKKQEKKKKKKKLKKIKGAETSNQIKTAAKGKHQMKRRRKLARASAAAAEDDDDDDDGNSDYEHGDDQPWAAVAKRTETGAFSFPPETVITTPKERDEALARIYANWGIDSINDHLPGALFPELADDDADMDWRVLAKLSDLSRVTKTRTDATSVMQELESELKDKVGRAAELLVADITLVGESYYCAAQQRVTAAAMDEDSLDELSNAASVDEERGGAATPTCRVELAVYKSAARRRESYNYGHDQPAPPSVASILSRPLTDRRASVLTRLQVRRSKAFRDYKIAEAQLDVAKRELDWFLASSVETSEAGANRKVAEKNLALEELKGKLLSLKGEILRVLQQRRGDEGGG